MLKKLRGLMDVPAVEQRTLELSGSPVTYTLKRSSKRRSIGLRIDDRGLTVAMPLRASEQWLHSVLQDKAQWIVGKLADWQAKQAPAPQWVNGQLISFMGEPLSLRVVASLFDAPPLLRGRELFVHVTDSGAQDMIGRSVVQWYKQQAEVLFRQRVAHYAAIMAVSPRVLKLSDARTQWGSCTARGVVRLNWQLVKMPLRLIDYVVVHELAHLTEMNHSAAFWQVVKSVCPDYAQRRSELRGKRAE